MDKNTDINLVRQHIGMVFQHFNLFPHLSVLENITLAPMDLKKESKEAAEKKAIKLLQTVGLEDKKTCIQKCFLADKSNGSLSLVL